MKLIVALTGLLTTFSSDPPSVELGSIFLTARKCIHPNQRRFYYPVKLKKQQQRQFLSLNEPMEKDKNVPVVFFSVKMWSDVIVNLWMPTEKQYLSKSV